MMMMMMDHVSDYKFLLIIHFNENVAVVEADFSNSLQYLHHTHT